jgi:hypothetical protein
MWSDEERNERTKCVGYLNIYGHYLVYRGNTKLFQCMSLIPPKSQRAKSSSSRVAVLFTTLAILLFQAVGPVNTAPSLQDISAVARRYTGADFWYTPVYLRYTAVEF